MIACGLSFSATCQTSLHATGTAHGILEEEPQMRDIYKNPAKYATCQDTHTEVGEDGIDAGERDPIRFWFAETDDRVCACPSRPDLSVDEETVLSFIGGAIFWLDMTCRRSIDWAPGGDEPGGAGDAGDVALGAACAGKLPRRDEGEAEVTGTTQSVSSANEDGGLSHLVQRRVP